MKSLLCSFLFLVLALVQPRSAWTQTLPYLTSGELSPGKSSSFAGGSACCNCRCDHYGLLPADLVPGRISVMSFYLRGSRSNSYYTRIQNGPTTLKLVMGDRESTATSAKTPVSDPFSEKASWILRFPFSPPAPVAPNMPWKLIDGDGNKYSAVLLHSSDVDLEHGISGNYKTYGCQYDRVEPQSYSVVFEYAQSEQPVRPANVREKVYKSAVVEFTERGVEAIVTGSVLKFGDIMSVTAKVIDVETAKIIDSADIKVQDINHISARIESLAQELAIDP